MAKQRPKQDWFVYVVRCADGSLYTGTASDVARRFAEHASQGARCAKYLRGKAPLRLEFVMSAGDRAAACRLEAAIKKLPRARKEMLVRGVFPPPRKALPAAVQGSSACAPRPPSKKGKQAHQQRRLDQGAGPWSGSCAR